MVLSDGEQIARVEGIVEELRGRMNVQIGLTVAMWVSLAGLIATIFLRH